MSTTLTAIKKLFGKLSRKSYRDAFVIAEIENLIPFQIRAMRKERGWNQEDLAKAAGMNQGRISLLENPDHERGHNIVTLARVAAAFDVALIVRFAPFSELVEWSTGLSREHHNVPDYQTEVALSKSQLEGDETGRKETSHSAEMTLKPDTPVVLRFPPKAQVS